MTTYEKFSLAIAVLGLLADIVMIALMIVAL
jgi:hypothetical protein